METVSNNNRANVSFAETFVNLTGMHAEAFVAECAKSNIEPLAECERAIRSLFEDGQLEFIDNDMEEQIEAAKFEIKQYID